MKSIIQYLPGIGAIQFVICIVIAMYGPNPFIADYILYPSIALLGILLIIYTIAQNRKP